MGVNKLAVEKLPCESVVLAYGWSGSLIGIRMKALNKVRSKTLKTRPQKILAVCPCGQCLLSFQRVRQSSSFFGRYAINETFEWLYHEHRRIRFTQKISLKADFVAKLVTR